MTLPRMRVVLPSASPLRGRYLAANPGLRALLTASDMLLAPLRPGHHGVIAPSPRRVLIAVNGHLGDAVIATAAMRLLADALPDVELGVLVPSWSRVALDGHPQVRRIHTVDHWHTSRARGGLLAKWLRYRRSRRSALREIRAVGYDVAVDLYDYFPNAALLLWRAGIPVRVGYTSAGFSALYTHAVEWPDDLSHTAERHAALVRMLVAGADVSATPRYDLPPTPVVAVRRVQELLERERLHPGRYTVLHVGAGSPDKEWPLERWREVAAQLAHQGEPLVFTGQGPEQRSAIRALIRGLPRCVDLSDRLEWHEFVHVIRLARHTISVDTVAGHLAAATGTPSTILWTSVSSPHHWCPLSDACMVLVNAVPCAPCIPGGGCAAMSCLHDIDPRAVLEAVRAHGGPPALDTVDANAPVHRSL